MAQKDSGIGRFVKGAIGFAIVAAVGLALFGAAPIIFGALMGTAPALTGAAVLGGIKTAFASWGLMAIGGAAVIGGGTKVIGGAMRDRQEAAQFEAEMQRAQAMETPSRGRARNVDFSGVDSGINYDTNWRDRARGGQAAGVAQPTPRI